MKSKKDEGNDFFKKEKYQQAVICYSEYVSQNNPDNAKAYTNMGLSYFKLKNYPDCVKACQSALEIEPQNLKAQYRMYEAFKELKDTYGMLIAGQKFCKLSKDQTQLKPVRAALIKVKDELCYPPKKTLTVSESDQIILQIVNQLKESTQVPKVKKQPLTSLQSKWLKIQRLAKDSRRLALNQARKFINQECKTPEEKENYKKLFPRLTKIEVIKEEKPTKQKLADEQTDSSEEDLKIDELKKYNEEKERKAKQSALKNAKKSGKKISETEIAKVNNQKISSSVSLKATPASKPAKQVSEPIKKADEPVKKQSVPAKQVIEPKVQEKKPSEKEDTAKNTEPQGKWSDFVNLEDAQKLFQIHIKQKMAKHEDQFIGLYQSLTDILRSTEIDRFQKEAVLSLAPTKVKKFNLLIKSYTGKEKQELSQLFTENNLHTVMEKYLLKK